MNVVDAAYKILQEAGKPLHYTEITRRTVQAKLWLPGGKAPEQTVNGLISQEITHHGKLARFVRLGGGMYAAVAQAASRDPTALSPDLAFVSEAWRHLPIAARQRILQIVRETVTGHTDEVDDPVIAAVLPDGPKRFPADFLNGEVGSIQTVDLPEEELGVRQLAGGSYVVESHFGFRHDVRNETEGMFIVRAHARGARSLDVPDEMIHLFKAVKGYESYLRATWHELYRAYGRECGDRTAAFNHAKTAFETLGLPVPADVAPPAGTESIEPGDRKRRTRRGARTPEPAFYAPILQALFDMGGSGKTAEVIKRVGEIMGGSLSAEDRELLQSTGMPRWDSTSRFARHSMVRNGLLKSDSSWGVWEMSDNGLEYLSRLQPG